MEESIRTKTILVIKSLEKLSPTEEGVELNEGYDFEMNGAIPEIADGLAKMAIEMDKNEEFGEMAGGYFLQLVNEYYNQLNANK